LVSGQTIFFPNNEGRSLPSQYHHTTQEPIWDELKTTRYFSILSLQKRCQIEFTDVQLIINLLILILNDCAVASTTSWTTSQSLILHLWSVSASLSVIKLFYLLI